MSGEERSLVEGERIVAVGGPELLASGPEVIDLGDVTLLPGLVDAHPHPLIAGDDYQDLLKVPEVDSPVPAVLFFLSWNTAGYPPAT